MYFAPVSYTHLKQTVHNVILSMKQAGLIRLVPDRNNAREKLIELTDSGNVYAEKIMIPCLLYTSVGAQIVGIVQIIPGAAVHRQDLPGVRVHDYNRRHIAADARLPLINVFLADFLDIDIDRQLQRCLLYTS